MPSVPAWFSTRRCLTERGDLRGLGKYQDDWDLAMRLTTEAGAEMASLVGQFAMFFSGGPRWLRRQQFPERSRPECSAGSQRVYANRTVLSVSPRGHGLADHPELAQGRDRRDRAGRAARWHQRAIATISAAETCELVQERRIFFFV